eukprot:m51a1_g5083 putative wd repeat domain phosphoinositide-interacting protein 3 (349) ;mRNA; r:242275-244842
MPHSAQGPMAAEGKQTILYLSFNQDRSWLCAGTTQGFRVYTCDPFKEHFNRTWNQGIGIVEVLLKTNILALVGGGDSPKFPVNKMIVWDDFQNKCIAEMDLRSAIRAVRIRRERIVIVDDTTLYLFNFADLQMLHQINTTSNPTGLCALSTRDAIVVACPGAPDSPPGTLLVDPCDSSSQHSPIKPIVAHNNRLVAIALSDDGRFVATASERGTVLRVFNTATGELVKEVRRGADAAVVYSLALSPDGRLLVASSDRGTCHVFQISTGSTQNRQSSLKFVGSYLPSYFSSEWSAVQFPVTVARSVVGFGPESSCVFAASYDGKFMKVGLDLEHGKCSVDKNIDFMPSS